MIELKTTGIPPSTTIGFGGNTKSNPLTLVVVNGSYGPSTKTGALLDIIIAEIADQIPVELRKVEIYGLGKGFTNAFFRSEVSQSVNEAIIVVEHADILVVGSPVYQASYTGLFKHFFDMIAPGALVHKPVLLSAVGGSERHSLMIEYALRPLFSYFNALIVPTNIYATADDLNSRADIHKRIKRAVKDLTAMLGVNNRY